MDAGTEKDKLRVIVAHSDRYFLDSACWFLAAVKEIEVVAKPITAAQLLVQAVSCKPDVVVVAMDLEGKNGLVLTCQLKKLTAAPKVIVVSPHGEPVFRELAAVAGADGYLTHQRFFHDILPQFQRVFPSRFAHWNFRRGDDLLRRPVSAR
jgi:two-component system response regulator DesR